MRNWGILHWRGRNHFCYSCGLRVRHFRAHCNIAHQPYPGGPTLIVSPTMYNFMKRNKML